jgi:CDP-diglyceride synthetase
MKQGKISKKRKYWYIIIAVVTVLVVITFTPLVLNPGKIHPKFLSLPYTLWTSMLITIILVLLTYLGSRTRNDD